jgi:hypothetical protein
MAHLQKTYPYEEENANMYLVAFMGYLKRFHTKNLVDILLKDGEELHYSIEVQYDTILLTSHFSPPLYLSLSPLFLLSFSFSLLFFFSSLLLSSYLLFFSSLFLLFFFSFSSSRLFSFLLTNGHRHIELVGDIPEVALVIFSSPIKMLPIFDTAALECQEELLQQHDDKASMTKKLNCHVRICNFNFQSSDGINRYPI